ncbi:MAG TPA: hypothetical protein VLM79_25740 [Kofleriaceae bacterium]|nr:hypothetical protein [Kofleriaceae bacterium]
MGGGAFLVRANATTGAAVQAKLIPGSMDVFGVAINGTHIAVVGQHTSAIAVDACNLVPAPNSADAMILDLLTTTLACQWSKHFGDSGDDNTATTKSVAAYPGGGWVIVGNFRGSILLADSGTFLTSRGDFDVFAGRFAANGTHIWSFRYGNTGFDLGESVAVTPEGNAVFAGSFDASITFGSITVNGVNNVFVTRMTAGDTPTHEWAVGLGGDDSDQGESVALGADGTVYVLGQFNGMTTVAGTPFTSQAEDAWIASLVR